VALKIYASDKPFAALVLAHGAGAGQFSSFMVESARGLAARGVSAATFDFPYITAKRKVPDRAPILEQAWQEAIDAARADFPGLPLFVGGKSMGGRIATHVASQKTSGPLAGVVLLGYPLHPPGRPDQRRDTHLPEIDEPMLFVQGERDAFGGSAEIRELLPRLRQATVHEIQGGDHSFRVPGGKVKQQETFERILTVAADWMRSHVPGR
jgi:predicted alpha/beta-hydrolase family hydrolase